MNRRFLATVALMAVVATSCGGGQPEAQQGVETTTTVDTALQPTTATTTSGLPTGPSALTDAYSTEFPPPLVDPADIISGGPPPDGIPPIENPQFLSVADNLALLEPNAAVVALVIDDDARAYPVAVMIWHEIVNDTVGGVPVSVTYCPLCNSAVTHGRVIDGVETTFGTSGRLYSSALVMYDRATESLWTHFDGRAVVGVLAGYQLDTYASPLMSWEDFVASYPKGRVLDETATGFSRPYGSNPYVGYDDPDSFPFLLTGGADERARAMERVVGVSYGGVDVAYTLASVTAASATVTEVDQGRDRLVILWAPGQSTALESSLVIGGRDVGSVGVFVPQIADRRLTLRALDEGFVDEETGSTWTVAGVAIAGALAGAQLERVPHLDTFWFAWARYRPGSELVGVDDKP